MRTSSSGVGHRKRKLKAMTRRIPAALRGRLEDEATFGLIELLEFEKKDWSEHVLSVASDRFERRLAQELGAFKSEVSKTLNEVAASIRQDTATARLEMLKWSFVFWLGQVAAVTGARQTGRAPEACRTAGTSQTEERKAFDTRVQPQIYSQLRI